MGFPGDKVIKNLPLRWRPRFDSWVGKIPWKRAWQPTPVFLTGEFHGQRSLASWRPWSGKQSDMTEQLILTNR